MSRLYENIDKLGDQNNTLTIVPVALGKKIKDREKRHNIGSSGGGEGGQSTEELVNCIHRAAIPFGTSSIFPHSNEEGHGLTGLWRLAARPRTNAAIKHYISL